MNKIIILYILFFFPLYIMAQIGINTESPTATLEIKSGSKTAPVVLSRNSANVEFSRLLDNGYLGMARTNPVTKVDLRGTLPNAELGLGTTTMTAAAAGAGAIRYNNGIEYSDGNTWIRLATLPTKAYVIARHNKELTVPSAVSTTWDGWTVEMDATNSFDGSTFTAPRNGVYSISCTGMAENVTTTWANLHIELNLKVSSTTASDVKSAFSAPNKTGGEPINMTFVNKAFLYLQAGDRCYFYIWQNMRTDVKTTTDGSYNTLTISEM